MYVCILSVKGTKQNKYNALAFFSVKNVIGRELLIETGGIVWVNY